MRKSKYFKINIVTFILFLFFHVNLHSQWLEQNYLNTELWRVSFVNDTTGWILGNNYIYKTTDGGDSWVPQDTSNGLGYALCALNDAVVIYANWSFYDDYSPGIRRTTDGGLTWHTTDSSSYYYTDFEFVNDSVGYAAANNSNYNGAIRKTVDFGKTWHTIADDFRPSEWEITGLSFIDELNGLAVTYDAYIFKTSDGGVTWTLQDSIRQSEVSWELPLRDIQFVSSDSGWVVGGITGQMIVARTVDGGESWSYIVKPGASLRQVVFLNSKLGWVAGTWYQPNILRTTDGGVSWIEQTGIISSSGIESFYILNENLGWAVNWDGYIYKTTNGGVVSVENHRGIESVQPDKFTLLQNYPNPFNIETVIPYHISNSAIVTLKIFDLRGNEIKTLINEKLEPGEYNIKFNAKELPSGLYFYRLKTEGFFQTNKFILIK